MPYRIAAIPDPIETDDEEEAYARVLRGQARRTLLGAIAVGLVVSGALTAAALRPRSSRASSARAREAQRVAMAVHAIGEAKERAAEEELAFGAAIADAAAPDSTHEEASPRPCPIVMPPASTLVRGRRAFPIVVASADDDLRAETSPSIQTLRADVGRAEKQVSFGRYEEATAYARGLAQASHLRYDVVFVARRFEKPTVQSVLSYTPGFAEGRAYVYDFASHRVLCVADVVAKSSAELGYAYATNPDAPPWLARPASLEASLDDDLRLAIERAIVDGVRAR